MSGRGQAGQSCCIDQITCSPPLAPPPLPALPDNSHILELCGVMRETKSPSKKKSGEYNVFFSHANILITAGREDICMEIYVFLYMLYIQFVSVNNRPFALQKENGGS